MINSKLFWSVAAFATISGSLNYQLPRALAQQANVLSGGCTASIFLTLPTSGLYIDAAGNLCVGATVSGVTATTTATAAAAPTAVVAGTSKPLYIDLFSSLFTHPTYGDGVAVDTTHGLPTQSADGASVTLGAKADAKSTATDTTPITIMSVLKQVSASVQAAATSLAGTLTVATHAVTQSGTWTVQPGNTANITAWKVDGSAVTQPSNTAQVNGVTTSTGQGTSGTGTQRITANTNPDLRTLVTLDVKTVTTGGTAVNAISATHRTAGGWLQNPKGATIDLCINEVGTATGTTSSGDTTCIIPGASYNVTPGSGAVSVITSDSSHPFSGYGIQ